MYSLKNLLAILATSALLLSFTKSTDFADFSGEWKLNESKSELGQFANYAPHTIKVTQTSDSITIAKTSVSMGGEEVTNSEALSYDGKETTTTIYGNSSRVASARWSDDGQTLTITYDLTLNFNDQQTEVKGTEIWTLGDDGKTLVSQNSSTSSFGDMQSKGIYEK